MISSSQPRPKPKTGRKKVKIEKMQNESNLHVTFTKRRSGIIKKATALATLCGAEVAIIVRCPRGKKLYSFGHPTIKKVFDKYVFGNPSAPTAGTVEEMIIDTHRSAKIRELNLQLTHAEGILAQERKRAEQLNLIKMQGQIEKWYPPPLEDFSIEQLLIYKESIENFEKHMNGKAKEAMILGAGQSQRDNIHGVADSSFCFDPTNKPYYVPSLQNDDKNIHAVAGSSFTFDPSSSYPSSTAAYYAPPSQNDEENNHGVAGPFCVNPDIYPSPFEFNLDDFSAGFADPEQYGAINNARCDVGAYEMPYNQMDSLFSELSNPNTYGVMSPSSETSNSMLNIANGSNSSWPFQNPPPPTHSMTTYTTGLNACGGFNDGTGGIGPNSGFNNGTSGLGLYSGFDNRSGGSGPNTRLNYGMVGGSGPHSAFNDGRAVGSGPHRGFNDGSGGFAPYSGFNDGTGNSGPHG